VPAQYGQFVPARLLQVCCHSPYLRDFYDFAHHESSIVFEISGKAFQLVSGRSWVRFPPEIRNFFRENLNIHLFTCLFIYSFIIYLYHCFTIKQPMKKTTVGCCKTKTTWQSNQGNNQGLIVRKLVNATWDLNTRFLLFKTVFTANPK